MHTIPHTLMRTAPPSFPPPPFTHLQTSPHTISGMHKCTASLSPLRFRQSPDDQQQQAVGASPHLLCSQSSLIRRLLLQQELREEMERQAAEQAAAAAQARAQARASSAEQAAQAAQEERRLKLETIHELLADGAYSEALELLSDWAIAVSGSGGAEDRDASFEWARDVLFYQMVARCEHGLTQCAFNSSAQRESITRAFQESKEVLARFRERREESREFILALQSRVYSEYYVKLLDAASQNLCLLVGASCIEEAARWGQLQCSARASRTYTAEEADELTSQRDAICEGVRFITQLRGETPISAPFLRGGGFSVQQWERDNALFSCLNDVVCKTLCLFDFGQLEEVRSYAHVALCMMEDLDSRDSMIPTLILAMAPLIPAMQWAVPHSRLVMEFTLDLLDSATYAHTHFSWKRVATAPLTEQALHGLSAFPVPLHSLACYMDLFLRAMDRIKRSLYTFQSHIGYKFAVESLLDPAYVLMFQFAKLEASQPALQDTWRAFLAWVKKKREHRREYVDVDMFWYQKTHRLAAFDKPKFDAVRNQLVRLLLWGSALHEVFVWLLSKPNQLSAVAESDGVRRDVLLLRFLHLLEHFYKLRITMMTTMSSRSSAKRLVLLVRLLLAAALLLFDLDQEANWALYRDLVQQESKEGGVAVHEMASGGLPKAEASALSHYSFSVSLRTCLPGFLTCFSLGPERKRIRVLARMAGEESLRVHDFLQSAEDCVLQSLVVNTFILLHRVRPSAVTLQGVAKGLEGRASALSVSKAEAGRWVEERSRRYLRQITRLAACVQELDGAGGMLRQREEAVLGLTRMLEEAVMPFARMPAQLQSALSGGQGHQHVPETEGFTKRFTWGEVTQLQRWMMQLDAVAHRISRHMSNAFGGNLAVFRSIVDPELAWSLGPQLEGQAAQAAAQDLGCIKDILEHLLKEGTV